VFPERGNDLVENLDGVFVVSAVLVYETVEVLAKEVNVSAAPVADP